MGRKPKLTHHQRQEAIARREAGESLVDIGKVLQRQPRLHQPTIGPRRRSGARPHQRATDGLVRVGALGGFVICIPLSGLGVLLSNPLDCVMLGNEALDCFRFAIGP
jgi:hypothetical protein